LYEYSKDESLRAEAIRSTALLEKEKNNTGTHDLGLFEINNKCREATSLIPSRLY
jgi:hypothetical protein